MKEKNTMFDTNKNQEIKLNVLINDNQVLISEKENYESKILTQDENYKSLQIKYEGLKKKLEENNLTLTSG